MEINVIKKDKKIQTFLLTKSPDRIILENLIYDLCNRTEKKKKKKKKRLNLFNLATFLKKMVLAQNINMTEMFVF